MARIELTIRASGVRTVADFVLAGLASPLDLTLETIDDLQLALETLLEHHGGDEVTIASTVRDGAIEPRSARSSGRRSSRS